MNPETEARGMSKDARRRRIVELITQNQIETQEELAGMLKGEGYLITQATISRDMKEMKLIKVPNEDGRQYYSVIKREESKPDEKYIRMLKDNLLNVETAQNMLVIKTSAGLAMGVAAAIDSLQYDRIIGCIAGDDTIMAATKSNEDAKITRKMLLNQTQQE